MAENYSSRIGKILVTGATGNVGSAVIANLAAIGVEVRALVRDESKAQGLVDTGVEVVFGDLDRPETLDSAFRGVDRVFLLTPLGPNAATQARNAITAAKRVDSPYVVRLSAIKAATDSPTRIGRQHAESEAELKASGLPYSIIRPHFYIQNMLMAAGSIASDSAVYMPLKDGHLGMIDIRDVGEVAAKVLTSNGHEGKTYTLTGPASISFHDVADGISKAVGRVVQYVDVPPEVAREAMVATGLPEWAADGYGEYFKAFSNGWGDLTTDDVERVTGKTARSHETFAYDFAHLFAGDR